LSPGDPLRTTATPQQRAHTAAGRSAVVGALGVVFGDIGTSPLYTVGTVFDPGDPHPVAATAGNVLGIASLIFWAVTVVVTITYISLVLRADNDGEGGILALITLLRRAAGHGRRLPMALAALGIFGASLFFGDSIITPAISVLSAVEGLRIAAPSLEHLIVPITAAIIIVLFVAQRLGTGAVGRLFGPVMIVWFATIGAFGVRGVARHPRVLEALSPTYAIGFLAHHFAIAFFALTAVVLAFTGAEAIYADMGHFGRSPITRAWLMLVFPACILSYLGQGALILGDPHAGVSSPFFLLVPGWAQIPMVLLATAATVIASQAVITGAYSVAHQAIQLGYLPRLRIVHTSSDRAGQIYVPWINWMLLAGVLTLVFAFESSAALAAAYGMAVTGTITITTLLFFYIARTQWRRPLWLILLAAVPILAFDVLLIAATLTKLAHGAWLPLLIAIAAFTVLTTWQRGRRIVAGRRLQEEGPLRAFVDEIRGMRPPLIRTPGTAVFLNRNSETAPLAMRATVEHLHALHEHVVILSIETKPVPHVPLDERLVVDDLGYADDGITHVGARFGYMDRSDVPEVLRLVAQEDIECPLEVDEASYFLSTIDMHLGDQPEMARWRKRLFLATSRMSTDAAEYFALPRDRTVIMGSQIDV
jgi:KUP system potassium uptake protein